MLSDVWHLPTACMKPSIKIVCCSLYPYRHNLVEFTLRIFHTCELFARILHNVWRIRTNFWGPFFDIISSSGHSFSYGLGTLQRPSVRPTVTASPPRPLVGLFLNLVRMFPSVSSCASTKRIPVRRQAWAPSAIFDFSCYRISSKTTWRIRMKFACCVCLSA